MSFGQMPSQLEIHFFFNKFILEFSVVGGIWGLLKGVKEPRH